MSVSLFLLYKEDYSYIFFLDSTYSELYLMLCGDLNGEEVQKGEDICIYTDDSFCCPQETNAAL